MHNLWGRIPAWAKWLFVVLVFVNLVALIGVFYPVWRPYVLSAERLPPPYLDFALVAERFDKVSVGMSREDVETLLGPPTHRAGADADLTEFGPVEKSHRFDLWLDPDGTPKGVLVGYGDDTAESVLVVRKRGF